jgi:hypothetical protein
MAFHDLLIIGMTVYLVKTKQKSHNKVVDLFHMHPHGSLNRKFLQNFLFPKLATTLHMHRSLLLKLNGVNNIPF